MQRLKRIISAVLAVILLLSLLPACGRGTAPLSVCFLDAGKADAIILSNASGCVIIDTGEAGEGAAILSYLEEKGITAVDCLILTHFDRDHVGGAAELIRSIPVRQVLQCATPGDSKEYTAYLKALRAKTLLPVTVENYAEFDLGEVHFTVQGTNGKQYSKAAVNNASLITTVSFGNCRFLFTADAEHARLKAFLSAALPHYDLVKLPHHGAWDSALPDLLSQTTPRYAVITSSASEPESDDTLALLAEAGITPCLTRMGPVTVVCDGKSLSVSQPTT